MNTEELAFEKYFQPIDQLELWRSWAYKYMKKISVKDGTVNLTSFIGGKGSIPIDKYDQFLTKFTQDIQAGNLVFFNQIAHRHMRLFVDIDATIVLNQSQIHHLGLLLHSTLLEYYGKSISIMCSVCGPKPKKGQLCTGVHFVAHVTVDVDQARQLTHAYRLKVLSNGFKEEEVEVDPNVIRNESGSLRMIYSYKLEKCPVCKELEKMHRWACTGCKGRGEVIPKKVYEPYYAIVDGKLNEESFNLHHNTFSKIVHAYSIWPVEGEDRSDFAIPPSHEKFSVEKKSKGGGGTKKGKAHPNPMVVRGECPCPFLMFKIREYKYKGERPWKDVMFGGYKSTDKGTAVYIQLTGNGARTCLYAKPGSIYIHKSNHTYFIVFRDGLVIHKCHDCTNKSGKKKGKEMIKFYLPKHSVEAFFTQP